MNGVYRKAMSEKLTELACMLVEVAGLLNSAAAEEDEAETADGNEAVTATAECAAEAVEAAPRTTVTKAPDAAIAAETPQAAERVYTYEEVRAALAEKARTGFRAEVRAILTRHGVKQLSEVKEQETFAAIMAEAEEIRAD